MSIITNPRDILALHGVNTEWCRGCAGTGKIDGIDCDECDGDGYFVQQPSGYDEVAAYCDLCGEEGADETGLCHVCQSAQNP